MKANGRWRARLLVVAMSTLVWTGGLPSGSAAQAGAQPVAVGGACESERYKSLLQTPFASMGTVEYPYFVSLDADCRKHKRDVAAVVAGSPDASNACIHPPYAALRSKAPRDMTKREYDYFIVVDRECEAYHAYVKKTGGTPPAQPAQPRRPSAGRQFLMGLTVLGSIIATLVASL